jgi:hypothetical protein
MLANPNIGVTQIARTGSASHRRRSIGTSRPREPRIRRAFDNGRSTPKTLGAPGGFQSDGGGGSAPKQAVPLSWVERVVNVDTNSN